MEPSENLQNKARVFSPGLKIALFAFDFKSNIYIYLQEELVTGHNGTDLKAKEKHELTDAPKEGKSITHTRENKQNKNICQEYCSAYNAYYNAYRKTICLFGLGVFLV